MTLSEMPTNANNLEGQDEQNIGHGMIDHTNGTQPVYLEHVSQSCQNMAQPYTNRTFGTLHRHVYHVFQMLDICEKVF